MTVRELKKILENIPDNMDVFIRQTNDEYPNSLVEIAEIEELHFWSSDENESPVKVENFIITDAI